MLAAAWTACLPSDRSYYALSRTSSSLAGSSSPGTSTGTKKKKLLRWYTKCINTDASLAGSFSPGTGTKKKNYLLCRYGSKYTDATCRVCPQHTQPALARFSRAATPPYKSTYFTRTKVHILKQVRLPSAHATNSRSLQSRSNTPPSPTPPPTLQPPRPPATLHASIAGRHAGRHLLQHSCNSLLQRGFWQLRLRVELERQQRHARRVRGRVALGMLLLPARLLALAAVVLLLPCLTVE